MAISDSLKIVLDIAVSKGATKESLNEVVDYVGTLHNNHQRLFDLAVTGALYEKGLL